MDTRPVDSSERAERDEAGDAEQIPEGGATDRRRRRALGRRIRRDSMQRAFGEPLPEQRPNGEEQDYPYVANDSKGLPHDDLGEVDPDAYRALLRAAETGRPEDFDRIPKGRPDGRGLLGPQGGLAFNLQGPDPFGVAVAPAPRLDSARGSAELAELYWMALLRDVRFSEFETSPLVAEAAADLSTYSDYPAPREGGQVTPRTLFRGDTPGDLVGPYVSQLLLQDIQYGTLRIPHRHDTVAAGVDHMTDFADYLDVQRGARRRTERDVVNTRYLQTPRDMGHYTHFDELYEPYLNAALILLATPGYPDQSQDKGNPYLRTPNQIGFPTFGTPHLQTLLAEVANLAVKHVVFQKFFVHRRLRPEVGGARIHVHRELAPGRYDGILHREILESAVLDRVWSTYGSYLLPQGFPEGCPVSSAYPAGHSAVAGACVTILKAWFDESFVPPNPIVPNDDGTALVPYTGPDRDRLTVGGELNKLANNVGTARSFAGVHWRSDHTDGIRLGEAVAIGVLRDQKDTYNENGTFTLTTFDGETLTI